MTESTTTEHSRIYWLHALTPLHIGVGFGLGFIDLPIMREKVTNWPMAPGSGIKGVLADYHQAATEESRKKNPLLKAAFGFQGNEHSNSGSLVFTDARIVCLPVRSLYGTFAWITSPLALDRLRRDLADARVADGLPEHFAAAEEKILVPADPATALKGMDQKVYLADLDLTAEAAAHASTWAQKLAGLVFPDDPAWQPEFRKRFGIVGENCFNFLCETGTEVTPRVRIDPAQKTVQSGALWYEEYLPAETILAGLVWCDRVFVGNGATSAQLMKDYCSGTVRLQLGGKATVGKGRVRCIFGGSHAR